MSIFDDIGKRVAEVAKNATKMTRDMADTTRLNVQISGKQEEIDKLYAQIGMAYFARYQAGGGAADSMDELCAQIARLSEEKRSLQQQIDEIKQMRRCPKCGSVQPKESAFCSSCGNRLVEERQPAPQRAIDEITASEPAPEAEKRGGAVIRWPVAHQPSETAGQPEEAVEEPEQEAACPPECSAPDVPDIPEDSAPETVEEVETVIEEVVEDAEAEDESHKTE